MKNHYSVLGIYKTDCSNSKREEYDLLEMPKPSVKGSRVINDLKFYKIFFQKMKKLAYRKQLLI